MKNLILTLMFCLPLISQSQQKFYANKIPISGVRADSTVNDIDFVSLDANGKFRKIAKDSIVLSSQIGSEVTPFSHVGSNGVSAHALADGSDAGFLSSENYSYLEAIKTVTDKVGMNFETIKYYAENGEYTTAGTHDLTSTFIIGDNTFSETDRDNNSIYEGYLYLRYITINSSTETDIHIDFAGDTHSLYELLEGSNVIASAGYYYVEIEYTIIFNTSPDTYTLTATIKNHIPAGDVYYFYVLVEDESYTNSGDLDWDIEIDNVGMSNTDVFRANLKQIN